MMLFLRDMLWSGAGIALLIGFGAYFTFRLRFIQLRPMRILRRTIFDKSNKNALSTFVTALGGTVGAGSITGVALGIAIGGAGSIFWMWVSGFFGMALRYAETDAVKNDAVYISGRRIGGAMVALKNMGKGGVAKFFCLMTLAVSLSTGCLAQSNAASKACGGGWAFGCFFALIFLLCVMFGKSTLMKISNILMPLCSLTYLALLFAVLASNISSLPDVIGRIFSEAFGIKAVSGGGIAGMMISMREGFSKGVFSNESGMGSAPLAYSSSGANPEWGVLEIFADTFLISTLSAFALLCGGFESVEIMFSSCFGAVGSRLFACLMCLFALASMMCWEMYGSTALTFLTEKRVLHIIYPTIAAAAVVIGANADGSRAWYISDIFNLFMILPNLYMLVLKGKKL